MSVPFPHRYSASLSRALASRTRVEVSPRPGPDGAPSLDGEPAGDVDAWSAEHVLLSLGLCMLSTFEAFAAREGIEVHAWDAKVNGTVEETPEGLSFTSIVLELDIEITGNVGLVEATLEHAKQHCLVLNSLRAPVVVETQVRTPGGPKYDCYDLSAHMSARLDERRAS